MAGVDKVTRGRTGRRPLMPKNDLLDQKIEETRQAAHDLVAALNVEPPGAGSLRRRAIAHDGAALRLIMVGVVGFVVGYAAAQLRRS